MPTSLAGRMKREITPENNSASAATRAKRVELLAPQMAILELAAGLEGLKQVVKKRS
jgi:hypothetical protein